MKSREATIINVQECSEDLDIKRAAAHIEDAMRGRAAYGKARAIDLPQLHQKCFAIFDNKWWNRFIVFLIVVHTSMVFWEPTQIDELPENTHWTLLVFEVPILVMYVVDLVLHILFYGWKDVWNFRISEATWIRVEFIFTCMFIIDYSLLVTQHFMHDKRIISPFRCLRLATIFCKSKNVAHVFQVCVGIILKLTKVMLITAGFIVLSSAIGLQFFMLNYHYINCDFKNNLTMKSGANCTELDNVYTGTFDNIGMSSVHMFVLLTTSSFPAVMWPAYKDAWGKYFFFAVFLYAGLFVLTAVLLAIIVENYWEFSKTDVKKERKKEREEIVKAFNILDSDGKGCIPITDEKLMKIFRILRPLDSEEEHQELIEYLDHDHDGLITNFDCITMMTTVLHFEFQVEQPSLIEEKSTRCWIQVSHFASTITEAKPFHMFIMFLIIFHSLLFCLKWYKMPEQLEIVIHSCMSSVLGCFLVELLLRALATPRFFHQQFERVNIVIVAVAVVTNILWYLVPLNVIHVQYPVLYKGFTTTISSLAVVARLALVSKQTKKAIDILLKIYPVMFDLILVVFIVVYFYGILGLEIFYGTPRTSPISFDNYNYDCEIGFKTVRCSMITVFQIVTTASWHDLMYTAVTNTTWAACIYFISCYFIIHLVIMNLFVAITIEAFNKLVPIDSSTEGAVSGQPPAHSQPTHSQPTHPQSAEVKEENENTNKVLQTSVSTQKDSKEQEDVKEDLSGLSLEERNKIKLKRRRENRKKKANNTSNVAKVVMIHRKKSEEEVNLHVGDEVQVLEKHGARWKGAVRGMIGWFPAKCVVQAFKDSLPPKSAENPTVTEETSKEQTLTKRESTGAPKRKSVLMRKNSDWRRSIHGDMTVINPEELLELNMLSKARIAPKRNQVSPDQMTETRVSATEVELDVIPALIEEEEEEVSTEVPKITISGVEHSSSSDDFADGGAVSSGAATDGATKGGATASAKDVPDWVKKFTAEHDLEVSVNSGATKGRATASAKQVPDWVKKFTAEHNLSVSVDSGTKNEESDETSDEFSV